MKTTQVVSFSSSASVGYALEQKPWPKKAPSKFTEWLEENNISPAGGNIMYAYEQYKSQCNGEGDLIATLRVRLHDLNTPYTLRATFGQLGQASMVEDGRQEYLAFELSTEQEIAFGEITAAAWNGDVYDGDGDIVSSPPAPTLSGRRAAVPAPLYGVLEVSVVERLYEYPLTISPRTPTEAQLESRDAIHEQLYASKAMLFVDNRIIIKDVDMPDDFGTCAGGEGGTSFPEDPEEPEESGYYDVTFEAFNYCTGAPVNGASIRLSYKDAEGKAQNLTATTGTPVRLPSGSYNIRVTAAGYTPSNEDDLSENDSFTLSAPSTP